MCYSPFLLLVLFVGLDSRANVIRPYCYFKGQISFTPTACLIIILRQI